MGIIFGRFVDSFITTVFFLSVVFLFSVSLYQHFKVKEILGFVLFTALGIMLVHKGYAPQYADVDDMAKNEQEVYVSGFVEKISHTKKGTPKIVFNVYDISTETTSKPVEQLKIQIITDKKSKVTLGENLIIRGELNLLEPRRNPGAFDEFLYSKTRNISYKMFGEVVSHGAVKNNIYTKLYYWRDKISSVYESILPQREAALLEAMLLGNSDNLDDEIRNLYAVAGIVHIIAISGVHISLISLFIFSVLQTFLRKEQCSAITIIILVLYTIFTGGAVATVRATYMSCVVLFGYLLKKQSDIYTSIAFSALTILMVQPLFLFDIGFLLSYVSIIAVVLVAPFFSNLFFIPKILIRLFACSIGVSIVISPITAYFFHWFSLAGILANVVILPFASIIVIVGLMSGFVGLFSLEISQILCGMVFFILKFYEFVCLIAEKLPFSKIVTGKVSIVFLIFYYLITILVIYYLFAKGEVKAKIKKYIILTSILFLIFGVVSYGIPKKLEVVFIDVGQGDSIFIKTADHKNMLIDGGGSPFDDSFSVGKSTVLPFLLYERALNLDCVFVTHPDADHIEGVIDIMDDVKINRIFVSDYNFSEEPLYRQLISKAEKYKIKVEKLKSGDSITVSDDLHISCVSPNKNSHFDNINDASLVLKMSYKNNSFLFTGDATELAENIIIDTYKNELHSDVLKAGHHGSKTSSSDQFVKMVDPKIAVISAGKNNRYGHPSKKTLDTLHKYNVSIFNTQSMGAIIMKSDGKKIYINTMKN